MGGCGSSMSQQQTIGSNKHNMGSLPKGTQGNTGNNNIFGGLHGDNEDGDSDNIDDGEENLGFD